MYMLFPIVLTFTYTIYLYAYAIAMPTLQINIQVYHGGEGKSTRIIIATKVSDGIVGWDG